MKKSDNHDQAPITTALADAAIAERDIASNPFFADLRDGTMSLEEFRRAQEPFYYAVHYFPRPMAMLVARIPDPHQRLDILHNLVEEHGDFDPKQFHEATFRSLLQSIGSDVDRAISNPISPAVQAFNTALMGTCLTEDLLTGIACMGMIEYVFADLSAIIGNAIVQKGWVEKKKLSHYSMHAAIDKRHAQEFFAIIESGIGGHQQQALVKQGLALGVFLLDRLYRDLYQEG